MYLIEANKSYDFSKENYSSLFPNLHRYPATMLPQIGIQLFKELGIKKGALLDPYCGTGSSFLAGIMSGLTEFHGFDINPLAVLIAKARYTKIEKRRFLQYKENVIASMYEGFEHLDNPNVTNISFWFSRRAIKDLNTIKHSISSEVENSKYQNIFWTAFSETVRSVSYTRNGEFKLYRIEKNKIKSFKPDVFEEYLNTLNKLEKIYMDNYYPILKGQKFFIQNKEFSKGNKEYDVVLTSPPYGDSRTTVAYGQYSTLSNEWMDIKGARKIDSNLMGGYSSEQLYEGGILEKSIKKISKIDRKRALQVSAFYMDLESSIKELAQSIKRKGHAIYIAGNRTVKNVKLPTDQFIAEQFERSKFKHLFTYERNISSKVMPLNNSPSNLAGKKVKTMNKEYIVVCRKK